MTAQDKLGQAEVKLGKLRRAQLNLDLVGGAFYLTSAILLTWTAGTFIELLFNLDSFWRMTLLVLVVCVSIAALFLVYLPILTNPCLKKDVFALEWWALALGKSAPDLLRDRLLNAVQLARSRPSETDPYSEDLARHALLNAVGDMGDVPIESAIRPGYRNQGFRTFLMIGGATLVIVFFGSSSLLDAANRILHPSRQYQVAPSFTLSIDPPGGWVYRGEPVEFTVKTTDENLAQVEFTYAYEGGEQQFRNVRMVNGSGTIRFEGFRSSIWYSAESKGVISPVYQLEIVARPQVSELQYRLFPPRYSRLPVEAGKENIGDVDALPGSELELTVRATKNLAESYMIFHEIGTDSTVVDTLVLQVNGHNAFVRMGIVSEGSYYLRLKDINNHWNSDPIRYQIRMLVDDPPIVRIAFPEEDVLLGEEMKLPLRIEADDDFGISGVSIAFHRLGSDEETSRIHVQMDQPGSPSVIADHLWDLSDMGLMPGDVLEYWAVAHDNDNIRGPKSSESDRRLVRLPSLEEIVAGVEQSEEASMNQAEMSLEAARELQRKVSEIIEEIKRNPVVDWEQQREVESAVEEQENIQKKMEALAQSLDQMIEQMDKHDMASAETLEKYRELQELIAEITTPELKEAMEKLQRAMETQDPDAIRKALEQFDLDREQYLQSIERSISILQQLQLERKMDELVKLAEEMLHDQEIILEKIDSIDGSELAAREEAIAKTADQFEKALSDTRDMAAQMGEERLTDQLDSLVRIAAEKDIPTELRNTGSELAAGRIESARSMAESNARDLAEMAVKLSSMAKELKQRKKDELAGKIRRFIEDLLYVSHDQEELAEASKDIGTKSPRYRLLAGQQEDIRQALDGIINRLFEVSKETFFITPELGAILGNATVEMTKALDGYTSRNPRSVSTPQRNGLGEVNRATHQLMDILGQLNASESSSGYEEMMQKLSEMASAQQGLNQQTMPIPGAEGQHSMPGGEQMARMAAQQRALQQKMQQLSDAGKGMREVLGDLEGIAEAMGEVANKIEDRNVDERTRRLQKQIVSRLLDATRSVRQQEYSKKRESRTGTEIERRSPAEIRFDPDREKLRRDLMKALQEGYTRDYRQLIRSYFRSLEEDKRKQ